MSDSPSFDDIFTVMSAASVGDLAVRVALPGSPQLDDTATRFAIALNILLDDLSFRVSALRQSEEQLRQAQKMEAVGRLAGGVAHDFNNVLSVILSYGALILQDLKPTDPLRADVEEICKAASRGAGLTRQLLMFSRQQVLEPRVIDLGEVLTSMDKMLQRILVRM
jgi:two-component system cell cycle sensor histidine kinase/response regulator CckA